MKFAEETGWIPVACPSNFRATVGPDNGVCGFINQAERWTAEVFDVVDAHGNLVGHMGGPHGGGFVPLHN